MNQANHDQSTTSQTAAPSSTPTKELPSQKLLTQLTKQADAGDRQAQNKLREYLQEHRSLIRQLGGDLCYNAEHMLASSAACNKGSMIEAIGAQRDHLRESLSGAHATPLEEMLVGRVVVCWLALQSLDQQAAMYQSTYPDNAQPHSRDQDRAHRRFLSAVKALATVRKMLPADESK